jgi:prophage antirepressor-like protein
MELQKFNFNSNELRVIDRDGEPWFVAKDVADVLGYSNPQKAVRDHCKKGERFVTPFSNGVEVTFIPESDVYRLVMRSKLPSAEAFQDWVMEEVLPSIRKTGQYQMQKLSSAEMLLQQASRTGTKAKTR